MRYRILTSDNDFSFGNGALNYYFNVPASVGQAVETGLLLWLGEWYLDISLGTPYIEGVLGKYSQATADATIQTQVLNVTGVVNISSYASQINSDTRAMSIQLSINTIYGPTQIQINDYTIF